MTTRKSNPTKETAGMVVVISRDFDA
ncbi:MAG: hypothetical protein JWQ04_3294, partial [Pedosphaera sp.]|nr:hypothetical protein [Pedosphaera sp.]